MPELRLTRAAMSLAVVLVCGNVAQSAIVYSLSDETIDNAFTNGTTMTVANHFNAVAGGETIQEILIAWGQVANGTAFTARLWSDPNGDGSPSDAVQLSSLASTVSSAFTSTYVAYNIPDVTLLVGQSFFVGFTITQATGEFPAALDSDTPISNQGWSVNGTNLQSALSSNFLHGDWMIRANGVAADAPVPEPASLAIWGLGTLGCAIAGYRRRKAA